MAAVRGPWQRARKLRVPSAAHWTAPLGKVCALRLHGLRELGWVDLGWAFAQASLPSGDLPLAKASSLFPTRAGRRRCACLQDAWPRGDGGRWVAALTQLQKLRLDGVQVAPSPGDLTHFAGLSRLRCLHLARHSSTLHDLAQLEALTYLPNLSALCRNQRPASTKKNADGRAQGCLAESDLSVATAAVAAVAAPSDSASSSSPSSSSAAATTAPRASVHLDLLPLLSGCSPSLRQFRWGPTTGVLEYSLLYTRAPDAIHHFGRIGHHEPEARAPFL